MCIIISSLFTCANCEIYELRDSVNGDIALIKGRCDVTVSLSVVLRLKCNVNAD